MKRLDLLTLTWSASGLMALLGLATIAVAGDPVPPTYVEVLPDSPSYPTAVKRMYGIHEGWHPFTLYCGCPFQDKTPDLAACHMGDLTSSRAQRTEAEHVVPASVFGQTRPCWEAAPSGKDRRNHCVQTDPVFHAFYADLHNLRPVVGAVNAARSNYPFGLVDGEARDFGRCDFEVAREDSRAEPTPEIRGDVARIWRYVADLYGLDLTQGQREQLQVWSAADPVDAWEVELDKQIEKQQGNSNPFVR